MTLKALWLRYYAWFAGGLLAGFGIALLPLTSNVLYWSHAHSAGFDQALFGGCGNLTPGLILLAIVASLSIQSLIGTYTMWFILHVFGTYWAS